MSAKITADFLLTRMLVRDPAQYGPLISIADLMGNTDKQVQQLVSHANRTAKHLAILANTSPEPVIAGITDMARISMVYFRGFYPGLQETTVGEVVQLPKWVSEIEAFTPLGEEAIRSRLLMAQNFGLLAIGPDECIAVTLKFPSSSVHVHGYENNELGFCQEESGLYDIGLTSRAKQKTVANLNVTQASEMLAQVQGSYLWRRALNSDLQNDRMRRTIELLEAHIPNAPPERNHHGNIVTRSFIANGDTGSTANMRPRAEGWVSYPTSQDAWYYGVWINPIKFETLSYCEQDVTHVKCENQDKFFLQLEDMAQFHGRSLSPSSYAFGGGEASMGFDSLSLLRGKYRTIVFAGTATIDQEEPGNSSAPFMVDLSLGLLNVMMDIDDSKKRSGPLTRYEDFDLNWLDPRSFGGPVQAAVEHSDDHGWKLKVSVGETTYETSVEVEEMAA